MTDSDRGGWQAIHQLIENLRLAVAAWDDKQSLTPPLFREERAWAAIRKLLEAALPPDSTKIEKKI